MTDKAVACHRWLAGMMLALLAGAPAFAATYNIGLFEGATGTGTGSFAYTNVGTGVASDPVSVSDLATNGSSVIGARSFAAGTLNVQVAQVDFDDGKTPPNQITGFFVEGLQGTLRTAPASGLTGCPGEPCAYQITFNFTAATPPANPGTALKTYKIELIDDNATVVGTPVPAGTYSVANTAAAPEPGSIALLLIGIAALAWVSRTRRRRSEAIAG